MSDLFDAARERLVALGWKRLERYGSIFWERPSDKAWVKELDAISALPPEETAAADPVNPEPTPGPLWDADRAS